MVDRNRERRRDGIVRGGRRERPREDRVLEECRRRGLARTRVVRLPKVEGDLDGTRKIVSRVANWLSLQENLERVEGGNKPRTRTP